MRCTSTGRICNGYAPVNTEWTILTSYSTGSFVWRSPSPRSVSSASLSPPLLKIAAVDPSAFDFFRYQTASTIAGELHTAAWIELVLQAAHEEPTVMHAALALGSLDRSRHGHSLASPHITPTSDASDRSKPFKAYSMALASLKTLAQRSDPKAVDLVLLCSLLCICFEILLGDHLMALGHLDSALKIISSKSSMERTKDVALVHPRFKPLQIEPELVEAFERLDIHASSYVNMRPPTLVARTVMSAAPSASAEFATIADARRSLYQLANGLYAFMPKAPRFRDGEPPTLDELGTVLRLCQRLVDWYAKMHRLISRTGSGMSVSERRETTMLRIKQALLHVKASTVLDAYETSYDDYDADFLEIVTLSESLQNNSAWSSSPSQGSFSIELGYIYPLYFTALRCRDRGIRRRALCLLRAAPREEGIWNSAMTARIAHEVIAIEEEGFDEQYLARHRVPECTRVFGVGFHLQSRVSQANISFSSRLDGINGAWSHQDVNLSW